VVEQGVSGDPQRRWALVLPHRGYLVGIAVRRGMSWHDAEDCAQEAMARCAGFEGLDESRVVEFLVSTTMRLCVDRHRLRTRDERVSAKLVPWYVDEPSPEENACDRDEAAWVAAHIAALPASQRDALAAKAEGLSCAEIAARMGLSYKAVESLLSRARTCVRASLASAYALVFGMLARRRAVADAAVPMSMVALAAATVLVGGSPASRGAAVPVPFPDRVVTVVVGPARATAVGAVRAVGSPRGTGRTVPPTSENGPPAPEPSRPPLPIDTPDTCRLPVPHTQMCTPDRVEPDLDGVGDCLRYGVDISRGFECRRPSGSPSRP
jgi:RNA polymerase sigma factor (sigma-70 family)